MTRQGLPRAHSIRDALAAFLTPDAPVIIARLASVEGSAPREEGTYMLVSPDRIHGTIGGGFAEYETIAHARQMLRDSRASDERTIILGPDSGQCCGGRLTVSFTALTTDLRTELLAEAQEEEAARRPVMIFGAGHVGKAIAAALVPLPMAVTVVETREAELEGLPSGVTTLLSAMPEAELAALPPGAAVLILTHDHALDFLIAREALLIDGLSYVGMIGSATKRASFAGHFKREGGDAARLDRLVLPIGGSRVRDKRPAVIAAMVAAELLCLPPFPVIID